jgi:molybdate transport system substrate-binding protein
MKRGMFTTILVVSVLLLGAAATQTVKAEDVKIYAAAVVKAPLAAIAAEYETATGNKVSVVFDTAGATAQRFQADSEAALLITNERLIRNAQSAATLRDGTSTLLGSTFAAWR